MSIKFKETVGAARVGELNHGDTFVTNGAYFVGVWLRLNSGIRGVNPCGGDNEYLNLDGYVLCCRVDNGDLRYFSRGAEVKQVEVEASIV